MSYAVRPRESAGATDTSNGQRMTDENQPLLPLHAVPESEDTSARIVGLTDEEADLVFDALFSTTARRIYTAVSDEPAAPPELAETLDLSLQNVHYHLRNLQDAGLIEPVGTSYSEKGIEMTIYAPAADPLVLTGGGADERSRLRDLLERLLGGVVVFGLVSVFVHWALTQELPILSQPEQPGTGQPPVPGPIDLGISVPFGFVFFAGGMMMLLIVIGWWAYRNQYKQKPL